MRGPGSQKWLVDAAEREVEGVGGQGDAGDLAGLNHGTAGEKTVEVLLAAPVLDLGGHGLEYQTGAAGGAVLLAVATQEVDYLPVLVCQTDLFLGRKLERK